MKFKNARPKMVVVFEGQVLDHIKNTTLVVCKFVIRDICNFRGVSFTCVILEVNLLHENSGGEYFTWFQLSFRSILTPGIYYIVTIALSASLTLNFKFCNLSSSLSFLSLFDWGIKYEINILIGLSARI